MYTNPPLIERNFDVRTVAATRYVTPLREGGSLPAIVEADDLGTYVLKFRGAGQGPRVLIAELIAGELARVLGLPMPEVVFVEVDPALGRSEPDPEIHDLIAASSGLNLALDYLPGSITYDPLLTPAPDAELASAIVWFDAFITNVDRTARNTNMLIWHRKLWLIDHGASLYFQYAWPDTPARPHNRFPQIKNHVLLPLANDIQQTGARLSQVLSDDAIREVASLIPDLWLADTGFETAHASRAAYAKYLITRLQGPREFEEEAEFARALLV